MLHIHLKEVGLNAEWVWKPDGKPEKPQGLSLNKLLGHLKHKMYKKCGFTLVLQEATMWPCSFGAFGLQQ